MTSFKTLHESLINKFHHFEIYFEILNIWTSLAQTIHSKNTFKDTLKIFSVLIEVKHQS